MTTFSETAKAFYAAFETRTRDGGESFTCLRDGSPEWMTDAIHSAHDALGGRLPDDWTYNACRRVVQNFADDPPPEGKDLHDLAYDVADYLTDIETHKLLAWLASHIGNAELCDQAAEDYGTFEMLADDARSRRRVDGPSFTSLISDGQLYALRAIAESLVEAITKAAESCEVCEGISEGNTCCDSAGES